MKTKLFFVPAFILLWMLCLPLISKACCISFPAANFTGSPTSFCPLGGTVVFTDLSTVSDPCAPITSWTWTFSGGTPNTYNGQTPPPIAYNTAGVYDVTLSVSNGTVSTLTRTAYIKAASAPCSHLYYSKASGEWNAFSTWSTVACGNATNTGTYPAAGDTVVICSGNIVTMTAAAACKDITIQSGGVLTTSNFFTLKASSNSSGLRSGCNSGNL